MSYDQAPTLLTDTILVIGTTTPNDQTIAPHMQQRIVTSLLGVQSGARK